MAKIIWEGNQPWGAEHPELPLPENAVKIKLAENPFIASLPYGIIPMLLCFAAVFIKESASAEFMFDLRFMPIGFIIGFLALPLHEFLHAVCYPRGATVYVGICIRKIAAYAVSAYPIGKGRYIIMSLAPVLLGIVPLCIFMISPPPWRALLTVCIVPSFMGLISPSPDYMDVLHIAKQVPNGAKIQPSGGELFWFK